MNNRIVIPQRGEIWWVDCDPAVGSEIQKRRPAIVISSDAMGALPAKLVVPLTGWKDKFAQSPWHVRVEPDAANGLQKTDSADVLQMRAMDTQRFVEKKGRVSQNVLEEIAAAIAAVVEYQ